MSAPHDTVVVIGVGLALMAAQASSASARADTLSIYQIQSETTNGDASIHHLEVVDCPGGIVTAKIDRSVPRMFLQHPDYPDGWGAIQVKDLGSVGAFDDVNVGDWVSLTDVQVEEYRGTTLLQWDDYYNPGMIITTSGVPPVPSPLIVSAGDIPAPIYNPGDDSWRVENHDAEPYESMILIVRDVTLTETGLGKANDNYVLQNPQSDECWAADYLNVDKPYSEDYHPYTVLDRHYCAVAGALEQYTKILTRFDYYQLLTLSSVDLAICGDGDNDGDMDLVDMPRFAECMTGPMCDSQPDGCDPPAWMEDPLNLHIQHCLMMDQDYDGDVDLFDFVELQTVLGAP